MTKRTCFYWEGILRETHNFRVEEMRRLETRMGWLLVPQAKHPSFRFTVRPHFKNVWKSTRRDFSCPRKSDVKTSKADKVVSGGTGGRETLWKDSEVSPTQLLFALWRRDWPDVVDSFLTHIATCQRTWGVPLRGISSAWLRSPST